MALWVVAGLLIAAAMLTVFFVLALYVRGISRVMEQSFWRTAVDVLRALKR